MSKLEVNAIEPQSGTTLTLGASGDTITIPAGATISNSGTAAGFGPTGAVSWNTTKITANPNPAVTGVGYFCDTTTAAFTVTLPSSPAAGAVVGIADYANTFATNNITVGRNGSNIGGVANNAVLSTSGVSVTFVYVDATQGWIVTDSGNRSDLPTPQFIAATGGTVCTSGDYKIHTFTGPGTFTVSSAGNSFGSNSVDYLIIAGGGGAWDGGGGAGGYRTNHPSPSIAGLPVTAQGYPITVGSGGAGNISPANTSNGNPSIFSTITSAGGGRSNGGSTASAGGSGGGGGGGASGGAGNTPPVSPPQGNDGGSTPPGIPAGSGGGGSGGVGNSTTGTGSPRAGGAGTANSITGSSVTYASGGGGGGNSPTGYSTAPATPGGGGPGIANGPGGAVPQATTNGTANTGGGGGGAWWGCNGNGGSGIVIIKYKFQ